MSPADEKAAQAAQPQTQTQEEASLLDQVVSHTGETEKDWLKSIVDRLPAGRSKSVTFALTKMISEVDAALSTQLAAIMHAPEFLKLEGSWRGLHYLVHNSETCETLKIKVLNVSKRELFKDLDTAIEFTESNLWKRVYSGEFGQAGGTPFGTLVGDYEFENHPEDISLLTKISSVAAGAFCPFISAAGPKMYGFKSWTELNDTRDLGTIFDTTEYIKWRAFRDTEDSRFTVLTFPRVLARSPYGSNNITVEEFNFEEVPLDSKGRDKEIPHDHYCWMNCAWAQAARMTDAFSKTNWCTAIRGYKNGGKVESLPAHIYMSDKGGAKIKCPTEVLIPDTRDAEISKLGFLALCNYKDTDYSVFFGAQTCQKPKKYDKVAATENAAISARLPYIMAASRINHYLKMIARNEIGNFLEASDMQDMLDNWIAQYVCRDSKPDRETKARLPLAEAKIVVAKIKGKPGAYNAEVRLRPWLQMEELNAAVGMVAEIPRK